VIERALPATSHQHQQCILIDAASRRALGPARPPWITRRRGLRSGLIRQSGGRASFRASWRSGDFSHSNKSGVLAGSARYSASQAEINLRSGITCSPGRRVNLLSPIRATTPTPVVARWASTVWERQGPMWPGRLAALGPCPEPQLYATPLRLTHAAVTFLSYSSI